MTTEIQQWLDSEPSPEEISVNDLDGSKYLSIEVIEKKLNELTEGTWQTKNFKHFFFMAMDNPFMSGSLELVLFYDGVERTLTGTYCICLLDYDTSKNLTGALKSLCIVNAASELGLQFGAELNEKKPKHNPRPKTVKKPVEMIPDESIKAQYIESLREGFAEKAAQLVAIYPSLVNCF